MNVERLERRYLNATTLLFPSALDTLIAAYPFMQKNTARKMLDPFRINILQTELSIVKCPALFVANTNLAFRETMQSYMIKLECMEL